MLTPKGYTTREQIENYLLTNVDETFWAQVDDWIAKVEAYIETATGRVFIAATTASARLYDGDGEHVLPIDDCVEVTGIEIDGVAVDVSDYYLYPPNTLPKKRVRFMFRTSRSLPQNVEVTAKWGYSVAVPPDIAFAATILAAGIINYSSDEEGEVKSMSVGSYSVTYKDEKQWQDFDEAKRIIALYRKMEV